MTPEPVSVHHTIRQRLEPLRPEWVDISDDSHLHAGHDGAREHAQRTSVQEGTHFSLKIVSPLFAGQSLVARHRMIYDCLGDLMHTRIHALQIDARPNLF